MNQQKMKIKPTKKNKLWTILGGTGLLAIFGVISFFQQMSGYTAKDFIEKLRAEEEALPQSLPGNKMEQPFPSKKNKFFKNDHTTKTEDNIPEKADKLVVRERDTELDCKEDTNLITSLIRIEGTGVSNTQMDSITAWNKAKEIAIKDLFMQSKDTLFYRVDYEQSFSRHRMPPNDGIYDSKVVVFGYIKKFDKRR